MSDFEDFQTGRPTILVLIPARAGSKGIPGKNLVHLGGVPLLSWSIEQARATPAVDRVVVSTDGSDIADEARKWGAEVVRRPPELSGDEATSESALLHALDTLRSSEDYEPDLVMFLQATSPLRRRTDLADALDIFEREEADSLFSASSAHGFVWRQGPGLGDGLRALTYDPDRRPRRQEIGEDLVENGSIYIFRPKILREYGNRLGGKIAVFPMHPLDSYQIDEPADLELFEQLLAVRPSHRPLPDLAAIRLLVLDFDGVLTDDRVVVRQDGFESVTCHRGDGLGLEHLRKAGRVEVVVLSKEKNPVVAARCRKLGVACHQGYDDKLSQIRALAAERGLAAAQVAYLGNDVNDLPPMGWCGIPIAVADAHPDVLKAASFATCRRGGRGAVREICDLLLDGPVKAEG